jgi:hypothetical protein
MRECGTTSELYSNFGQHLQCMAGRPRGCWWRTAHQGSGLGRAASGTRTHFRSCCNAGWGAWQLLVALGAQGAGAEAVPAAGSSGRVVARVFYVAGQPSWLLAALGVLPALETNTRRAQAGSRQNQHTVTGGGQHATQHLLLSARSMRMPLMACSPESAWCRVAVCLVVRVARW